ncbi:hypothetical protein ACJRO7_001908 [Eucalyptus globulus]|uniref:SPARK domain-containing protein n=1 Tax=Eucalyptus globulus TaxID=34317 RepID=A0ABD3LSG5_EUCGL
MLYYIILRCSINSTNSNFNLKLLLSINYVSLDASCCSSILGDKHNASRRSAGTPDISPSTELQPFLPSLAPSPLMLFTNAAAPKLSGFSVAFGFGSSGLCSLNFSAAQSIMSVTATNCWASFAPYLANAVSCPQFDATLVILMGQSSKNSGMLALNATHFNHCLSDVLMILNARGAYGTLRSIRSVSSVSLIAASCPVIDVSKFESSVDTSRILTACEIIDPVKECCDRTCQNAILDGARKLSLNGMSSSNGIPISPEHSNALMIVRIVSCDGWQVNWIPPPLTVFKCEGLINARTHCCETMESYVSYLQGHSFLTNLQALNFNVSKNPYNLCHTNLKDFLFKDFLVLSERAASALPQESGCLPPSLASFICDHNDNIAAPWPSSTSLVPLPSCNKTLQKATSAHCGNHSFCSTELLVQLFFPFFFF